MPTLILILWLANILLDTVGQLAFKAAAVAHNEGQGRRYWLNIARMPAIWLGVGCYGVEFLLWLAFLSLVPLAEGVLLGSLNIVAILIGGRILFREKLTPLRIAGIMLVASGVAVVGAC